MAGLTRTSVATWQSRRGLGSLTRRARLEPLLRHLGRLGSVAYAWSLVLQEASPGLCTRKRQPAAV